MVGWHMGFIAKCRVFGSQREDDDPDNRYASAYE
jgi:hypothetical protein